MRKPTETIGLSEVFKVGFALMFFLAVGLDQVGLVLNKQAGDVCLIAKIGVFFNNFFPL